MNPEQHTRLKSVSGSREAVIDLIGLIIIAGFALAVFYHYYLGHYMGLDYPYNTFLFRPADHFNDFKNGLRFIDPSLGGPAWDPGMRDVMWKVSWPFIILLHYPFFPFGLRWGTVLWLGLFIAVFLVWCVRHLKGSTPVVTMRNAFVFSFLTYPFLFEVDRANPEMFVFIFMAAFFGCYGTSRHYFGLVALAAAVAMKALPGVYLVLLLCDRRFKDFFLVGVLAVGLNLIAAAILPGGFEHNVGRWLFQTTDFYQTRMVLGYRGLMFGNSLWGLGKEAFYSLLPAAYYTPAVLIKLQLPYLLASFASFALLVFYVIRYEKVLWKRVALLAFAMILLPYVSADYRLLHVFFPLFMFINSKERGRYATFYAVMFALLLIPKDYIHLSTQLSNVNEVSIQIILNPLIMAGMSLLIIWEGLQSRFHPLQAKVVE